MLKQESLPFCNESLCWLYQLIFHQCKSPERPERQLTTTRLQVMGRAQHSSYPAIFCLDWVSSVRRQNQLLINPNLITVVWHIRLFGCLAQCCTCVCHCVCKCAKIRWQMQDSTILLESTQNLIYHISYTSLREAGMTFLSI